MIAALPPLLRLRDFPPAVSHPTPTGWKHRPGRPEAVTATEPGRGKERHREPPRMANSLGSNASFSSQKMVLSESSQAKKSLYSEEEIFYMNCRAAYLAVFKSSLENIKSKEQLCLVLQQAGRNPSQKTIDKYWTPQTITLNFDDFCNILKKEKPATKTELIKAFLKVNTNNDGYILHTELYKILTMRGEKMTVQEVNAITELADVNSNGKLDYNKFCKLYMTTIEQCCKTALEKLEVDSRLRCQQFGSQIETSSERPTKSSSRTTRKIDHKSAPTRGDSRTSSRPSSSQNCRASISSTISMSTSRNTNSELIESNTVKFVKDSCTFQRDFMVKNIIHILYILLVLLSSSY